MVALLLFIVFGLLFGYFATLNTSVVSVHLGSYTFAHVSLYVVVLASLGLGVVFATVFYFVKSLTNSFAFHRKEGELGKANKEIAELQKKVHQLELENTKLKTQTGDEDGDDDSL